MKFKNILKKNVTELRPDRLAHILDIPYELAELIQLTLVRRLDEGELKFAEEFFNNRMEE